MLAAKKFIFALFSLLIFNLLVITMYNKLNNLGTEQGTLLSSGLMPFISNKNAFASYDEIAQIKDQNSKESFLSVKFQKGDQRRLISSGSINSLGISANFILHIDETGRVRNVIFQNRMSHDLEQLLTEYAKEFRFTASIEGTTSIASISIWS